MRLRAVSREDLQEAWLPPSASESAFFPRQRFHASQPSCFSRSSPCLTGRIRAPWVCFRA